MLDDTNFMKDNNAPIWNERSNAIAWKLCLGNLFGSVDVPKYAAPARETDYSRLPPTYNFVGSIEPFYDETVAYIKNLQRAAVDAQINVYEKCYHAFDSRVPKAEISRRAID